MSDYDENEWEEHKSDSDFEETDSIPDVEDIDVEETQKKNDLLEQKLKLVLRYNAGALDLDQFNKSLKQVNNELNSIEIITEYANSDLVNQEYSFIELLENYITEIRYQAQPGFINAYKVMEINRVHDNIKKLRSELIQETLNNDEPLESMSLDETFDVLIKQEEEYIKKFVAKLNKRLTSRLVIPRRIDYKSKEEYNREYIKFYRIVGKYIQGEFVSEHMNVTSLGSSCDKFEKKVRDKYLESIKLLQELPIKISESDQRFSLNRTLLKRIMMKVDERQLVECASQVEIYSILENKNKKTDEISPIILEKIKKIYTKSDNLNAVITKTLRDKNVQELIRELNNETLIKNLENEVFMLTNPSFVDYTRKIQDILFIFKNYPNFKKYLSESRISINQFVLFEKEIAFETVINVTNIKTRRNTLKTIKEILLKNTRYKNQLANNYKCNILAKRLELLILDISKTSEIYNTYYQKLIKFIRQNPNKIFDIPKQEILLYLKGQKSEENKEDYSKLSVNDIKALISQQKTKIEELNRKRSILERDVVSWECPLKVKPEERIQWENLLRQSDLNKTIKFRKSLLKRYNLPEDYRISELISQIVNFNEKLEKIKKELSKAELREEQQKIIINIEYPSVVYNEVTINKTSDLINELIQSYKRKLMLESLSISQHNKNKLISLLEILDLNDILYKNGLLQKKLVPDILNLLPPNYNYFDFNLFYYNLSREQLIVYFRRHNLQYLDLTSVSYIPGSKIFTDFYGSDLFDKLKQSKQPEDFYTVSIQRECNQLNNSLQTAQEPEYRRLKVLYNPYTGKFGQEAQDGYLFDVEKLSISGDGKPLEDIIVHESIDPRTNQMIYKKVKVPVPGKHTFIKVPVLSNKNETYTWLAVRPELTKMYPDKYDTCSRFDNNEIDCKGGKGLGNSPCRFNEINKKCTADYESVNFGKSKFGKSKKIQLKKVVSGIVYSLSAPKKMRHLSLIKRIRYEQKKTGKTKRSSAIAIKKRLVVLKTFRKNKPQFKKVLNILNQDINFINKKFKLFKK